MTTENYKAILKRFNSNRQTQADEQAVAEFAYAGEPDYRNALERFRKHHEKAKETQLDLFFENGLMMPFKDDDSAMPKEMLRGSLFAPIRPGRRKLIEDKVLAQYSNGEIRYTGAQLDQSDLDVLLQLIKLLSEFTQTGNIEKIINEKTGVTIYSRIKFKSYSFLKAIGLTDGQENYMILSKKLNRLGGKIQVIQNGQGVFNGSIIGDSALMENGDVAVDISHKFVKLFSGNSFSFLDMESRLQLTGAFTKWLQGFVSTHTGESGYSADKLIELSGSKPKRKRDWRKRQAVPAFEQLKELGLIKDFSVKGYFFKWVR